MIIAVDPGVNGGIAWKRRDGASEAVNMPDTRGDTIDLLRGLTACGEPVVAYHEKVANYIPAGGASQMMTFGRMAERCSCILETLGIPVVEIPPKQWQKELNLGNASTSARDKSPSARAKAKNEWKNKLKAEAQRRHPHLNVTLKTADALLILSAAINRPETQGH